MNRVDVSTDYFGVIVRVTVSRETFDVVDTPEYYDDNCWVKLVAKDRVLMAFITHEPPEGS